MVYSVTEHTAFIQMIFIVIWRTLKCDVIYTYKYGLPCANGYETHKSLTEDVDRPVSDTEFVPNRAFNVDSKDINSFPPLSEV
jgi:hypothetical protein